VKIDYDCSAEAGAGGWKSEGVDGFPKIVGGKSASFGAMKALGDTG
jgi:hypothetical protein